MTLKSPKTGRKRSELLAGVILLGCGTLLALAICEGLVRVFLPLPPAFSWVREDGLILHTPGMRGVYARQEFRIPVEINSLGLRERELPIAKEPGTLRILLLGDSYAEGLQVRREDLLSSRLEKILSSQPGRPITVIDAGVSGYSTADELALLENLGWQLQPDLVLLAFCVHNDVRDNLERPLFDFSHNPPRRLGPVPPGKVSLAGLRMKEMLSRNSQLYQLLRERTAELKKGGVMQRLGLVRSGGNAVSGGAREAQVDFTSWFDDPRPASLDKGLEYTGRLLQEMQEEALSHHALLLAFWIPLREQVDDALWQSFVEKQGIPADRRARPQELLSEMVSGMDGLVTMDLLPAFLPAARKERLYFTIDGHWTPEGHRVAAETLAPALQAWRLGASADQPEHPTVARQNGATAKNQE